MSIPLKNRGSGIGIGIIVPEGSELDDHEGSLLPSEYLRIHVSWLMDQALNAMLARLDLKIAVVLQSLCTSLKRTVEFS